MANDANTIDWRARLVRVHHAGTLSGRRPARTGLELLVATHARLRASTEDAFAEADVALVDDIERYLDAALPGWRGTEGPHAR